MDFYAYSHLPKDARLNWFNTHLKPKLAKTSRRLHSIMEDGTLAEAFTSGKFSPDCTGSGKLNWGLSPLGFATRDARQTLKHQRQCKDFRQASHTTIRDVAKLRADNPPVPDGFDELANLIEDAEMFCKSTWGVKCLLYLMLHDITEALYTNKATLKSNYNFQYRVAGVILHYICLMTRHFFGQRLSKAAIKRGETVKPSPLCNSICQMIQLNSFMKPGQMAEHLQGPCNTNEPKDDSDEEMETKHQSNKRNADGKLKRGKDGIINKQTQFKQEPRELPTKWKNMLETYIKNHGRKNLPSSFKIIEILKADSAREASEKLGLGKRACLL